MIQRDRITIDPQIMVGKPVITGTRIPVEIIIHKLANGVTQKELLKDYPRLTKDDIKAALSYAADTIAGEEIFPLKNEAAGR